MNIIEKTQLLSSEKFQEAIKYWRNIYNEDYTSVSIIPNSFNDNDRNLSSYEFNLTNDQYTAISKFCKNDITLFTYFFTVYSILIYKITGREKILFSSPQLKNAKESYNKLLGIPVNFELAGTFKDLLIRNKDSISNSYKYNIYPLKEITEIADIISENDLVKNLIYFSGLHCDKQIDEIEEMANLGISCRIVKKPDSICCELRFDSMKYNEFIIQKLGESFSNILSQTSVNIDINIKDINLIENNNKSEQRIEKSKDTNIVSVFEEQVKLYPDKTSVVCPTDMSNIFNTYDITENEDTSGITSFIYNRYTYNDLNFKANQLAHTLVKKGIKENDIVALVLTPSFEMIVSIIAVLKAGGAYLPIDPDFPVNRVDFMLSDSKSKILITHDYLLSQFNFNGDLIDIDNIDLSEEPDTNLGKKINLDQLVYMIYTSGTSGQPKGVMLKHENIANYTSWFRETYKINQNDKSALLSSYAFDLGYTALFTSILSGAELHLISKDIYTSMSLLINYIKSEELTYLKLTPSLFSVMLESDEFNSANLFSLKNLLLGGEKIRIKDVEKAYRQCENLLITNHYGPTEATIGCITKKIERGEIEKLNNTTYNNSIIGRPIKNTSIFILNHENQLLPDGLPGEICISGNGLAKGYYNRDELTNERFIKINDSSSERIYKTGDLGRKLADGNIEFIGRIDTQLKVNGYRIELQEIEKSFNKLSFIDQAVVVPKKDNDQNTILYGYYKSKLNLSVDGLKNPKKLSGYIDDNEFSKQEFNSENIENLINNKSIKYDGDIISKEEVVRITSNLASEILDKYSDTYSLTLREKTRYKRQMLLKDWGLEGQEKLKSTKVFIAGAGGGASPTVIQLALAGFGTIVICDFDTVELSNLNRQVLHNESRIGMNKALSAQKTIKEINPNVNVIPITEKLTAENVYEMVGDCDMIFDMFDGQQDKFILSECAVAKGIPHFISAMTDINSYASVFHSPHTPCFSCLFDREKLDTLISGMKDTVEDYEKDPLAVVATSLFQSSSLAVNEAIKYVLYPEQVAYNRYFYINQKGSSEIINSPSYQSMIFAYSNHFLNECKQQGFDWENEGWRGKHLEELEISKNKDCKICFPPTGKQEFTINIGDKTGNEQAVLKQEQAKKSGSIAIITDNIKDTALCLISSLKLNIPVILLDKNNERETLYNELNNTNCRVLITNDENLGFSEGLVNSFNKNIAVINIDNISERELEENYNFKWNTSITAYYKNTQKDISNIDMYKEDLKDVFLFLQDCNKEEIQSLDTYLDTIGIVKNEKILLTLYSKLLEDGDIFNISGIETSQGNLEERIKEALQKELPQYMVPAHLIELDSIPLTPNGKVDLKTLAELELKVEEKIEMPRNKVEETLCKIWSEVLGVKQVGINQNFFDIGGHSLKATLLISKIHKEIGVIFPLGEIFKYSTIESQASKIAKSSKKEFVSIPKSKEQPHYPLSSAQKRLYLLQQLDLNSIAYNIPNIIPLGKDADKEKTEAIFKQLIKRHESFRTSIVVVDNEPVQVINNEVAFEVEEISVENTEVEAEQNKFIKAFDLSKAPYLRVAFVDIKGGNSMLMVDMHHIISDATTHTILEKEFQALYSGEKLPPLPLQYRDYSQWQNSEDYQEVIKGQEQYWINKFEGEIPVLNLPVDNIRPLVQSYEGARVKFVLSKEETKGIKLFTEENELTLYMSLLSVFNILLSKLSGQEDIVVGTPIAGRNYEGLENIVGMFLNTLSIRHEVKGEETIREFVSGLKQTVLRAYENQNYQFEDLVDKVSIKRDTSRNPIFDVMFNLMNQAEYSEDLSGFDNHGQVHINTMSKFDLTLTGVDYGEQLLLSFTYCKKLFNAETIDRFIGYFKKIVTDLLNLGNNLCIQELEIIPEKIKLEKLSCFNEDLTCKIKYPSIQAKLEENYLKSKDNVAIETGTEHITYSILSDRAGAISNWIVNKNIEKESLIGVFINDKTKVIISILGILDSSCVFVPLDTNLPTNRIKVMVETVGLKYFVTDKGEESRLNQIIPELQQENILILGNILHNLSACKIGNKRKELFADKAYIYFTSGSSGTPKPILGKNKSLLQIIEWEIGELKLDKPFRVSQFASIGFDAFLRDMFLPLLTGGTICIPNDKSIIMDGQALTSWINQRMLTLIHCVPSVFKLIGNENVLGSYYSELKYILMAGEHIAITDLSNWYSIFGKRIQLVNLYGATETTLFRTFYYIKPEDVERSRLPIGHTIPGSRMLIMDKYKKVCDTGILGELYIRTAYSTYGYYNDDQLTKDKFIENPYIKDDILLYRTGDLAVENIDGEIEIIGRIDHQVKIRGIRIELGEIESVLLKHENIKECVVLVNDEREDKVLCAYYTCKNILASEELRSYLLMQLPEYMVPSFFMMLEKFPLTANGKIHRKALPSPDIKAGNDYVAPSNETEKKLVEIWSEVLKIPQEEISINANFFTLGGHSLKATVLISKIHKELDVNIPLIDFFKQPTIKELYQLIEIVFNKGNENIDNTQEKERIVL